LKIIAAIDESGFFNLFGQGVDKAFDHPDGVGQDDRHIDDDQAELGAEQRLAEDDNIAKKCEEGDSDHDGGDELGRQNPDQKDVVAQELVAAESVGGERGQRNGDQDSRA